MNNSPLVSVLMTAHNREKYIGFAIKSVLASTYSNFELIILDDASTDETVNIVKKYAAKDSRIQLFINEENLGDYPNRNKAASLAKGKYLKYVDSDDYIYPYGLEIMVNSMERFPGAGFGLCSLKPDAEKPFPFLLNPKEAYEYHFFGPGLFHKGPLTSIFVKSAFDKMKGFKPSRMTSDTDMWYRMGLQYQVVLMQSGLVWQRIHAEQELAESQVYIVEREKIKWKYLLVAKCPLVNEQIKQIRNQRIQRYTRFILSGIRHFNFKQAGAYLKCLLFTVRIKI
ncbi:MAG: glycosyltransferase family 2 protein [Bacteroidota bacterium]|nr:glycosyltransferase family 2 protein [Bacteroidota bacterium]